jgi:hypothetical protein
MKCLKNYLDVKSFVLEKTSRAIIIFIVFTFKLFASHKITQYNFKVIQRQG